MNLSDELSWRGFTYQTTFDDPAKLDREKRTFYWGVDPSADSLTVGHLAIAMMVRHFIAAGHKAVLLVGGATGLVGDPDGKKDERNLKTPEEITLNKQAIGAQYKQLFDGLNFEIVDNIDWFKNIHYIDFLRDVGKHVPMRQMLGREFVQSRLGEDGAGISYAEFSYSLIQGYDFLHLFKEKSVSLQVCGADQWGNSIAGVELIRRVVGGEAHIWSAPLVINKSTGEKFGKTEAGAIWLDPQKTSIYQFYQFWLNTDDASAANYLKLYTLLSKDKIDTILAEFKQNPGQRLAQKTLAYEVTKLVHGSEAADSQVRIADVLFGTKEFNLTAQDFEFLVQDFPPVPYQEQFYNLVVEAGLASSLSEARRLDAQQAFSVNGQKVSSDNSHTFSDGYNLLKRGKNTFAIIKK